MWSSSQAEVDAWQHVAALVTKKYPDIHVKFTTTSFQDYFTKLKTQAASNSLPCIISLQSLRSAGFGSLYEPLDSQLKGFDLANFDSSIVDGLKFDGKQRAIPYDFGPSLIFYNADMFRKAGAKLPTPTWTMDDFTAAMAKIKASGANAYEAFSDPGQWVPWAVNRGNTYLKGTAVDFTNPGLTQTFSWYAGLVHRDHYAAQVPSTGDNTYPATHFRAGGSAMSIDGPWSLINTRKNVKFTLGIAPLPSVNGVSRTVSAGSGFGISSNCPDKESAWKAITVLTGTGAEQYLAEQGRAFPARKAQQTFWYKNAMPGAKDTMDTALATAKPFLTSANWDRVAQLMVQYGIPALNGSTPPANALQTVQSQASTG